MAVWNSRSVYTVTAPSIDANELKRILEQCRGEMAMMPMHSQIHVERLTPLRCEYCRQKRDEKRSSCYYCGAPL